MKDVRVLNKDGGVVTFPNQTANGDEADFDLAVHPGVLTILVDDEPVSWYPLTSVQGWWLV